MFYLVNLLLQRKSAPKNLKRNKKDQNMILYFDLIYFPSYSYLKFYARVDKFL